MKAKIVIGWEPCLSKNKEYVLGDQKLGRTKECQKAMLDIVMLLRPTIGYGWTWDGNRIQIKITAYRPGNIADAPNFQGAILDAIKEAIRVDDREFDCNCIGKIDRDRPRIEIEVSQDE